MDLLEAMRTRRSVRTYTGEPVPEKTLAGIVRAFDRSDRLNDLRLKLIPKPAREVEPAMTGLIGSYGAMKSPPTYLIGISETGENDQANFGFAMEQMILECTRLGLGTCWVGGFFKKTMLSRMVALEAGERIICVTPVGVATERRLAERSMRALGGLNVRRPLAESVFHPVWGAPAIEHLATRAALKEVFELARWAPSASNKQPCHYVVDDERIVLVIRKSLVSKYLKALGADRSEGLNFLGVDSGIAMAHIHLAAREMGIPGAWSLKFDEAGLRERYRLGEDARVMGVFELGARKHRKRSSGASAHASSRRGRHA